MIDHGKSRVVNVKFLGAVFISAVALTSVQLPSAPGEWGLFESGAVPVILGYSLSQYLQLSQSH